MLKTCAVSNRLLAALSPEAQELIESDLKPVRFADHEAIYMQGDPVDYLYFPINCVISKQPLMIDGASIEVAMVGREGVTCVAAAFGEYSPHNFARVLIPGVALKLKAETLREISRRHESVQQVLMHYYRSMMTQVSQRAVCNGRHTILQRLSCWLLMLHDRTESNDLQLTQEMIAGRLGARRAGITQAAQALASFGAITYSRGRIQIVEREIMEQESCECYTVFKAEFDFLKTAEGQTSGKNESPLFSLAG